MASKTLIFDVETTGTGAHDRVVSLAGLWCDGLEPLSENIYLVFNPQIKCREEAAKIHGLPDWWLRYQTPFASHASELRKKFSEAKLLVGHNIGFDLRMINHEFAKTGEPPLNNATFCTMQAFREREPSRHYNLDACSSFIGLRRSTNTHNAFEDTFLTMGLYRWLNGENEPIPPPPFPPPSNAAPIPDEVIWADQIDQIAQGNACPPPPSSVVCFLSSLGFDVNTLEPHLVRMYLAARGYACVIAKKNAPDGIDKRTGDLIIALANNREFTECLRDWSHWDWGRATRRVHHDALREFAIRFLDDAINAAT